MKKSSRHHEFATERKRDAARSVEPRVMSTSTEVRARIEQSLHTRSAPPGTSVAKIEQVAKLKGQRLWKQLRRRPSLGVLLVGGAGLALAMLTGVGELVIGVAAGYGAYQVLREGVAPSTVAKHFAEQVEKLA